MALVQSGYFSSTARTSGQKGVDNYENLWHYTEALSEQHFKQPNTRIITSILPRAEARDDARGVPIESMGHKQRKVRGGCLGAEGR